MVSSGVAELARESVSINGTEKLMVKLSDGIKQVDFILGDLVTPCGNLSAFSVVGEPDVLVAYEDAKGPLTAAKPTGFEVHFYDQETNARTLLPAHFQYYDDKNAHNFNRLAAKLQVLDCQLEQDKFQRIQMLSIFSPVLAAKAMGFPECLW